MKIIDNKKDYYDYLSGIYGIDDLIVYDRRDSTVLKPEGISVPGIDECFCMSKLPDDQPLKATTKWNLRSVVKRKETTHNKKFHFNKTWLEGRVFHYVIEIGWNQYCIEVERWLDAKNSNDVCFEYRLIMTKKDIKKRISDSPICISPCNMRNLWWSDNYDYDFRDVDVSNMVVNPIMAQTYIPKVIPPEEVWKAVYEYLSSQKEKPIVDMRNDIQKLESAGFDKKTSFRNV